MTDRNRPTMPVPPPEQDAYERMGQAFAMVGQAMAELEAARASYQAEIERSAAARDLSAARASYRDRPNDENMRALQDAIGRAQRAIQPMGPGVGDATPREHAPGPRESEAFRLAVELRSCCDRYKQFRHTRHVREALHWLRQKHDEIAAYRDAMADCRMPTEFEDAIMRSTYLLRQAEKANHQ